MGDKMSTYPQHASRWFLISAALGLPWFVSVLIGLLGAYPDLRALPETIHGIWGGLYKQTHRMKWWKWLIPPIAEHIKSDELTHKPAGGWYQWAYWLEGGLDIIVLVFFVIYWSSLYLGILTLFGGIILYTAFLKLRGV